LDGDAMRTFGIVTAFAVLAACGREAPTPAPAKKSGTTGAVRGSVSAGASAPARPLEGADDGPIEVNFPADFNAVTLRGRITHGQPVIYVVPLKAGDVLSARIVESNPNNDVVFSITSPRKRSLMGEEGDDYDTSWQGRLTETGPFRIELGTIESEESPYVLELELKNR
jgi:hypothetical protein